MRVKGKNSGRRGPRTDLPPPSKAEQPGPPSGRKQGRMDGFTALHNMKSHLRPSRFCFYIFLFYLKETQLFQLLVHSPNARNSQGWARLNQQVRPLPRSPHGCRVQGHEQEAAPARKPGAPLALCLRPPPRPQAMPGQGLQRNTRKKPLDNYPPGIQAVKRKPDGCQEG